MCGKLAGLLTQPGTSPQPGTSTLTGTSWVWFSCAVTPLQMQDSLQEILQSVGGSLAFARSLSQALS